MRCSGLLPGFWRSRQEWRDGLSAGIRGGVTERFENCCGSPMYSSCKLEKYRNRIFMIQHRHWTFHLELRAIQI